MAEWKILLIDDDAEDRLFMFESLKEIGSDELLHSAKNGEEAIEILNDAVQNKHIPSLIVVDLNMPKINGMQTIALIREIPELAAVPIVILTTSVNPNHRERARAIGIDTYFNKPLTFNEGVEIARKFVSFV